MERYGDHWMPFVRRGLCVVRCGSFVVNKCFKGHLLLNSWLDVYQTWQIDPYMAILDNCSNVYGPLRIQVTQAKTIPDENFENLLV